MKRMISDKAREFAEQAAESGAKFEDNVLEVDNIKVNGEIAIDELNVETLNSADIITTVSLKVSDLAPQSGTSILVKANEVIFETTNANEIMNVNDGEITISRRLKLEEITTFDSAVQFTDDVLIDGTLTAPGIPKMEALPKGAITLETASGDSIGTDESCGMIEYVTGESPQAKITAYLGFVSDNPASPQTPLNISIPLINWFENNQSFESVLMKLTRISTEGNTNETTSFYNYEIDVSEGNTQFVLFDGGESTFELGDSVNIWIEIYLMN